MTRGSEIEKGIGMGREGYNNCRTNNFENKNISICNNDNFNFIMSNSFANNNKVNSDDSSSDENDEDNYWIFENNHFLNSLSELDLNRLFNGLSLIDNNNIPFSFGFYDFSDQSSNNSEKSINDNILDSLPRTKIDDENIKKVKPNSCVICLDDFKKGDELIKILCGHWYHSKCILKWFKKNNTCPICKMEIEKKEL